MVCLDQNAKFTAETQRARRNAEYRRQDAKTAKEGRWETAKQEMRNPQLECWKALGPVLRFALNVVNSAFLSLFLLGVLGVLAAHCLSSSAASATLR
jgi:hypothetical protein